MKKKIHALQETKKEKIGNLKQKTYIFKETPGECMICGKKIEKGMFCTIHDEVANQVFDGDYHEYFDFILQGPSDDPIDQGKKSQKAAQRGKMARAAR